MTTGDRNYVREIGLVCMAVIVSVGLIVSGWVLSWRYIVNAGYEQTTVPGHSWPVWVKAREGSK